MTRTNDPTIATLSNKLLETFPDLQGIYVFGSWATEDECEHSDIDIAVLLPPTAEKVGPVQKLALLGELTQQANVDHIDLVFLREVETVFQYQIIYTGEQVLTRDQYAVDEFEMLTLSFYQKLNEERSEIIQEGIRSGRFYGA